MDRKFSKDISEYKKDIWKGFSAEEMAVIIAALIIGCLITYLSVKYFGISFNDAVYPASFAGIPVVYLFFKRENGIPLIKVMLRKRNLKKTSGKYDYKSSEMKIIELEKEERVRIINEEKRNKKRKRIV